MNVLVVGATGATGRLLVKELLGRGHRVTAVVRAPDKLAETSHDHPNLSIVRASLLDMNEAEMTKHVAGCDAVASCLGHNLTLKGICGHPRRLVTDAVRRLCAAIKSGQHGRPVKFVLMNTVGNRNRGSDERISPAEGGVIALLRLLVPPHADNEQAAELLRAQIGQNDPQIEWVVVRPDSLLNHNEVTAYEVYPSPTRSAIFNPGKTSRINVAHFMAELISDDEMWAQWKGQMPVIYNQGSS